MGGMKISFQEGSYTKPLQKEKAYSIPGIILLCFAIVHSLSLVFTAVSMLAVLLTTLTLLTSVLFVPMLSLITIVQAIRYRKQKIYFRNSLLSVLISIGLIACGWFVEPYISPLLSDFKTDLQISRYQTVVDKIHRGEIEKGTAFSVGGEAGHEDVAFLQYAIRFGASEFMVYSEDDRIDTKLLMEYDYEDRTDIRIKENWYRIRIED
ncbi:hypothetical protein ABFV83_08080 [Lacrimispora sp. BS-2]|uniref:Uncharacterized protein n=1 Tax=Lacrimispora sp. BS-2 TaxID=3151850 RepID=A0AAU7PVJ5_9FIRM